MSHRVDPNMMFELKKYGAVGLEKCINCGNCTAICSLSKENDRFPRHMVRMAQLGMKDELLGSKEIWLCYNCGDCSETCPQGAEPANFMAAARCYAITHYSPFNISTLFCKHPVIGGILVVLMVLFFSLFMVARGETMSAVDMKFFGFIPYELIHTAGLIAMVLVGAVSVVTIVTMMVRIGRVNNLKFKDFFKGSQFHWLRAFWNAVVVQSLMQKRYREECEAPANRKAWYLSKWFVHAMTMWGFLGLLLATALNYLLDIIGVKATGTYVPLWYPTRLIGTLSGIIFIYGVSVLLYKRSSSIDKAHSYSRPSDFTFLILLWVTGITGFIIEIALYLPGAPIWGYWMFIFHVAVSITLLLLLPFTKFAHAIYRIVALYIEELKPLGETGKEQAEPAAAD